MTIVPLQARVYALALAAFWAGIEPRAFAAQNAPNTMQPPPAATAPNSLPATPLTTEPAPTPPPPPTEAPASGVQIGATVTKTNPPLIAPGGAAGPTAQLDAQDARQRSKVDVPTEGNTILLSLDKALEVAMQQNGDLIVQRYNREEQRINILAALGIYDLGLTGSVNYSTTPIGASTSSGFTTASGASTATGLSSASGFDSTGSLLDKSVQGPPLITSTVFKEWTWQAGLQQLLPSGATVQLGWSNDRFFEPSEVTAVGEVPLPPVTYGSNLNFSVTQPLLQHFGEETTDNPIIVARANSEISHYSLESQIITTAQNVINAYWNLVNARESLVVAQESLQLARDLNEHNRIQVEVGTLAPLEMVQSEAAIATREEAIISAQAAIGNAEDQLRLLLNLPAGTLWQMEIRPTTPPETGRIAVNLEEATKIALANRPELLTGVLNVKLAKVNADLQHNLVLPQLNLVGGYGLTGANYTYSSTLNQVTGFDFRSWNLGLNFSVPIPNRAARAHALIADLDLEKNVASLDQLKLTVLNSVRTAARNVDFAAKDIDASHAARGYQEKNLDAEHKRYENGMSTSYLVTQIQDQLTQAKQTEVNSVTNYRLALAQYYAAIGKLLDVEGIQFVDPGEHYPRLTLRYQP